jgi:hypothetical protein
MSKILRTLLETKEIVEALDETGVSIPVMESLTKGNSKAARITRGFLLSLPLIFGPQKTISSTGSIDKALERRFGKPVRLKTSRK